MDATDAGVLLATRASDDFTVHVTRSVTYPIVIRDHAFDEVAEIAVRLTRSHGTRSAHVITDETVAGHYLDRLVGQLRTAGIAAVTVDVLPDGESSKSVTTLVSAWQAMHHRVSRRTLVIGLGGGVICDLTGLVAATFMRGLPYLLVPTSMIAQADAAVGGKCGVNLDGSKNLVGAFYHPVGVVIDPQVLSTLPDRDLHSGMAEVVKVALLADPLLFAALRRPRDAVSAADGQIGMGITDAIRAAVGAKLNLLSDDPFETGTLRRGLNLGHCLGHPLESATDYELRHGEAVAAGLAAAGAIGHLAGLCSREHLLAIIGILRRFQLPTTIPVRNRMPTWIRLEVIRRIRDGGLHLVVPLEQGWTTMADINKELFMEALELLDEATPS